MSFILDALKKSESERQRQNGPGVFQPRIASPRARFPLWAIAVGVLLGVNLLVLVWVMTRPDAEPPMSVPPAATSPAPASAAATAPAAAATTRPGATAPATRFNPPLIVDPAVTTAPDVAADGAAEGGPAAGAPSAPFNANDYVPAVPAGTARGPGAPATTSAPAPTPSSYATRESLLARGLQVPEASLSLHVFDANPARRFVFVNGQRGTEGETLPNGLRIEQIVPEGAVLSFNGNRFLVPLQ